MSRQGTKPKRKNAAPARTNQDRYDATRRALLDSARQLFAQHGYAGTNTSDVVDQANVTRGALYYHFRDKAELFEAVAEELVLEMREKVTGSVKDIDDPWLRLTHGFSMYLEYSSDPSFRRIVLQDGGSVIPVERWRKVVEKGDSETLKGVKNAMKAGYMQILDPETLAALLNGVVREAAFSIASAKEPEDVREKVQHAIAALFAGLKRPQTLTKS